MGIELILYISQLYAFPNKFLFALVIVAKWSFSVLL